MRTDLEPGLHLGLAGVGAVGGEPVPHGGVGLLLDRHLLGDGEPLGEFLDLLEGLVESLLGPGRGGGGPLGLPRRATCLPGEPAELLGDGRLLPVGGPAPLPQLLDQRGALLAPLDGLVLGLGQLLAADGQLLQLGGGLVDGGLYFEEAGGARGAAVGEVGAEEVALGRDGGEVGVGVDEVLGVFEGADDDDAVQQPPDGRHEVRGAADQVCGVGVAGVCGAVVAGRAHAAAAARLMRPRAPEGVISCQEQGGPATVLLAEESDRVGRGCRGRDRDGVRRRPEGGGQGDLVALGHRQEFRRRAEQAGEAVLRREQCPGAVLAAQAECQGLVPGLGGGAPTFRRGGGLPGCREGGLGLGELLFRGLVLLGECDVAGVEAVDLGLERLVFLLGGDGTFLRLVAGGGQAFDLGLGGGGAGAGRVDLAAEPGQALTPVGDGAGGVLQAPLLLRQ